jgi:cytochrome c
MRKFLISFIGLGLFFGVSAVFAQQEDMWKFAEQKGCVACHQVDKQLVGPAWIEVSKKYTEKDIDTLVNSVLNGAMGKWGNVPMPANKGIVTEEEARKLVKFVLSLKEKEGKKNGEVKKEEGKKVEDKKGEKKK